MMLRSVNMSLSCEENLVSIFEMKSKGSCHMLMMLYWSIRVGNGFSKVEKFNGEGKWKRWETKWSRVSKMEIKYQNSTLKYKRKLQEEVICFSLFAYRIC